jgi:hypothetical protein
VRETQAGLTSIVTPPQLLSIPFPPPTRAQYLLAYPRWRRANDPAQFPLVQRQKQAGEEALEWPVGLDRANALDGANEGATLVDETGGGDEILHLVRLPSRKLLPICRVLLQSFLTTTPHSLLCSPAPSCAEGRAGGRRG